RGSNEEQQDSQAFLGVAMMLALFLMFILLVTQFNSFYQALLILSAVIMSTAGVLLGLLISQSPFSRILTGTGVVADEGIVENSDIVLIDTFHVIRRVRADLRLQKLAVVASVLRVRPVFLVPATPIRALLPKGLGVSVDFIGRSVEHG